MNKHGFSKAAFTLIELLVVIAIIAVLAGLIIAVMGPVRAQADSTKCAAHLRQIGTAINSYCIEHDGELPGPLSEAQYPTWKSDDPLAKGMLVKLLEKYLDTPEAKGEKSVAARPETVMICPSWAREVPAQDKIVYVMNFEDTLDDYGADQVPWGDIDKNTAPIKKAVLSTWRETKVKRGREKSPNEMVNPAQTWAMKDADAEAYKNSERQPNFMDKLTPKPVHKDHRNALFYDFHVGRLDLNDFPK